MTKAIWDEIIKHGAYAEELDWFAHDNLGYIAVFTAVGPAPIPYKVKMSFEDYINLKENIALLPIITLSKLVTTEGGNFSSWLSYANKGLFAFDFQDFHRTTFKNQYDLIACPSTPLNLQDLKLPQNILSSIIKLDCNFSDGDLKIEKINEFS